MPLPCHHPAQGVKLKPRGTEALCLKLRETPTSRECQESTVSPPATSPSLRAGQRAERTVTELLGPMLSTMEREQAALYNVHL